MMMPRRSILIKAASVVVVLLISVYLITFHSERLDYETLKSGMEKVGINNNNNLYDDETNPTKHTDWDDSKKRVMQFIHDDAMHDKTLKKRTKIFMNIFNAISKNKPTIKPLDKYQNEKCGVQMVDQDSSPYFTYDELLKYLVVSDDDIESLKLKYDEFINTLPKEMPSNIYDEGTTGIVYVGGNQFTWLALMSIMNLRHIGSTLPVEILIPKFEEYELDICSNIFPNYNARCIYLPKLVGEEVSKKHEFKGYQYKSLALALSSFENVLLLDADNTPVVKPETFFHTKPFLDNGLVLWPDFWKRTTHPKFYDIINFKIDLNRRRNMGYQDYGEKVKPVSPEGTVLLHQLENTLPDPSTESGQLLINKREHFQTIQLILYFNTYGPKYFYPLLSQGAAGEGDKETFIAAAHALRRNYYTVKQHVTALGRFRNGEFFGSAMGQYNPIEDYNLLNKYAGDAESEINEKPSTAFIHANFPKLDPWNMFINDITIERETTKRNRLFGEDFIDKVGYDFELQTWKNMEKLLCIDKLDFANFVDKDIPSNMVCIEVKNHLEYLRSTTH